MFGGNQKMRLNEIWGMTADPVTDLIEYEDYIEMAETQGINAVIDRVRSKYPEYAKQVIKEIRKALRNIGL